MKHWIRHHNKYVREVLAGNDELDAHNVLTEAVFSVMTAENATGWYQHSGYL
jgi:hypothetical protein